MISLPRGGFALAAFVIIGSACAQTLTHERIGIGFGDATGGLVTIRGQLAYSGQNALTLDYDLFLGSANYSAGVLGGARDGVPQAVDIAANGDVLWFGIGANTAGQNDVFVNDFDLSIPNLGVPPRSGDATGFDSFGQPVWTGLGPLTSGNQDLFVGSVNTSQPILGTSRQAFGVKVTATNNHILWEGFGSATGGLRDVFRGTTNISRTVLGTGARTSFALDIANSGTTLWEGYSSVNGNYNDVFKTTLAGVTTNISLTKFGNVDRFAASADINETGAVAWFGGAGSSFAWDVFKDQVNISSAVVTGEDRSNYAIAINDAGKVLWQGASTATTGGYFDTFVDSTNVSRNVLGTTGDRDSEALGLTTGGAAIWLGIGPTTQGLKNVFYGSTNLTLGAYGVVNKVCDVLAHNTIGQVLWMAREDDGTFTVWLTTPRQNVTVNGKLTFPNYAGVGDVLPVMLHLLEPGTGVEIASVPVNVTVVDEGGAIVGNFSVITNIAGYHDIRVSVPGMLSTRVRNLPFLGSARVDATVNLGDTNADGVVDDADLTGVILDYGASPSGSNGLTDVDGDGEVGDSDITVIVLNFGLTGE